MKKNLIKVVFSEARCQTDTIIEVLHFVFIYTESIEEINKKGKHISPMNFSRCLIYQAKYPDSCALQDTTDVCQEITQCSDRTLHLHIF